MWVPSTASRVDTEPLYDRSRRDATYSNSVLRYQTAKRRNWLLRLLNNLDVVPYANRVVIMTFLQ